MKKIIFAFFALTLIVSSCKKDDDPISREVTLPLINVNGDKFITINVGDPVPTDEGATLVNDVTEEGGASSIMATESNVDNTTPGLYYMLYETQSQNGYHLATARYIAVTNYADLVDLSGIYERTSNGIEIELTRVSRALYRTNDMGGAGLNDALYFAVLNDTTIAPDPQYSETLQTEIYADQAKLTVSPTDTSFKYVLHAPGYGTALRTFVKVQ